MQNLHLPFLMKGELYYQVQHFCKNAVMRKYGSPSGRTDLMQKSPLTIRRRIYIRREEANGDRNRKYNKILAVFEKQYAKFYALSIKRT